MDNLIHNLDSTVCYYDDIVVAGRTLEETTARLRLLLQRLKENNLHVNRAKCKFFQPSIRYLGHEISGRGIQQTGERTEVILNAPQPRN